MLSVGAQAVLAPVPGRWGRAGAAGEAAVMGTLTTWTVINAFQEPPGQGLLCAGVAPAALSQRAGGAGRACPAVSQLFPISWLKLGKVGASRAVLCALDQARGKEEGCANL